MTFMSHNRAANFRRFFKVRKIGRVMPATLKKKLLNAAISITCCLRQSNISAQQSPHVKPIEHFSKVGRLELHQLAHVTPVKYITPVGSPPTPHSDLSKLTIKPSLTNSASVGLIYPNCCNARALPVGECRPVWPALPRHNTPFTADERRNGAPDRSNAAPAFSSIY